MPVRVRVASSLACRSLPCYRDQPACPYPSALYCRRAGGGASPVFLRSDKLGKGDEIEKIHEPARLRRARNPRDCDHPRLVRRGWRRWCGYATHTASTTKRNRSHQLIRRVQCGLWSVVVQCDGYLDYCERKLPTPHGRWCDRFHLGLGKRKLLGRPGYDGIVINRWLGNSGNSKCHGNLR